jgi:hypothetical protein
MYCLIVQVSKRINITEGDGKIWKDEENGSIVHKKQFSPTIYFATAFLV